MGKKDEIEIAEKKDEIAEVGTALKRNFGCALRGRPSELRIAQEYFMMGSYNYEDITYVGMCTTLQEMTGASLVTVEDDMDGNIWGGELIFKFEYDEDQK